MACLLLALRAVIFPLSALAEKTTAPTIITEFIAATSSRLIRSIPFGRLRIPLACQPEEDNSLTAAPRRLLIQPQHIPRRIPKPRRNLRGIRSDRWRNLSPVRHHLLKRRRNTIHHDIHQQPHFSHRRPSKHPRPAHLPRRIVKRHTPIAPSSDVPSKHLPIELQARTASFKWQVSPLLLYSLPWHRARTEPSRKVSCQSAYCRAALFGGRREKCFAFRSRSVDGTEYVTGLLSQRQKGALRRAYFPLDNSRYND